MRLKPITRLRVAAVNAFAHWLAVPITVHDHDFPEVRHRNMTHYIEEACYLMEHFYKKPPSEVWKFEDWAWDHLRSLKDNPFVLHDSPVQFCHEYMGFFYGVLDDMPQLRKWEDEFQTFSQIDKYYAKHFHEDWHAECARC
jgi:hypothetical protein